MGDFNGDGKTDLTYYDTTTSQWTVAVATVTDRPDLMYSASDGTGHEVRFSYKPLTDSSVYTKDSGANAAVYPMQDIVGPSFVVSQVRTGNGVGGFLTTDYRYGGKKRDLAGRGDLGFRWREVTDQVSHVTERSEYAQGFPLTGLMTLNRATHSSGVILRTTQNAPAQRTGSATGAVFAYASQTVESTTDLDGSAISTVTTTPTYDNFGGLSYGVATLLVQSTVAGGETYTTTTDTAYYPPDTGNWLVALPQQVQLTKTAPNVVAVARTVTTDYYPGTTLPYHETIEPNDTTYRVQTTFNRDSFGNVSQRSVAWFDPITSSAKTRNLETVVVSDSRGRWPITARNALNQDTTQQHDDAYGNVTSITDANNLTAYTDFDTFGRPVKERNPDGHYTIISYKVCVTGCGSYARSAMLVQFWASGVPGVWTGGRSVSVPVVTYYDSLKRVVLSQTWGANGAEIVSETQYDSLGRLYRSARARFTNESPVWSTVQYDHLGRAKQMTDFDGLHTWTYNGLAVTKVNPKSQSQTETVNGLGLTRSMRDALNNTTQYAYDPFGNLVSTTDPLGNKVSVTHDRLGRKKTMIDPDLGAWSFNYDPLGIVYSQTDGKSQTTTFRHDDLGRLVRRTETDLDSHWVYDTAIKGVGALAEAYTLNGSGGKDYRRVHTYDSLGRPDAVTTTIDQDYVTRYGYDALGRALTMSHQRNTIGGSSGPTQAFTFDYGTFGDLASVSSGSVIYWQRNARDALGRVTSKTLGNGLVTTVGFYPSSARLHTLQTGPGGGASVQNATYGYDTVGNLETRTEVSGGVTVAESYQYDSLNRLTTTSGTSGGSALPSKTTTPNAIGNLMFKTGVGTYNYPASGPGSVRPHAPSSITGTVNGIVNPSFAYDGNGNVTSSLGRTLQWTSFNMPSLITQGSVSSAFLHGPEHQRYRQIQAGGPGGTKTIYYAGGIEKEVTAAGTTVKTYLPMGIGVILETGSTVQTRYFHGDHLDSVRFVTREDGGVAEQLSFDAWGKRRNANGMDDTANTLAGSVDNKGYTGQEMLDNVRLVHLNGRVYDPLLGQMTSGDPIVASPLNPQNLNRYSYVLNNPLSFVDPTGFSGEKRNTEVAPVENPLQELQEVIVNGRRDSACFSRCWFRIANVPGLTFRLVSEVSTGIWSYKVPLIEVYSYGSYQGDFNPLTGNFNNAYDEFDPPDSYLGLLTSHFGAPSAVMMRLWKGMWVDFTKNVAIGAAAELGVPAVLALTGRGTAQGGAAGGKTLAGAGGNWARIGETPGGAVAQTTPTSCGAACGEMISSVPQSTLIERLGPGFTDAESLAGAIGGGFQGGVAVDTAQALPILLGTQRPFAVVLREGNPVGHFVTVDGMKNGNLLIRDSWGKGSTYEMTVETFMKNWSGDFVYLP